MNLLPIVFLTTIFSVVGVKTAETQCNTSQFDCGIENSKHVCIPLAWTCDGEPDCEDRRDEQNCIDASTCAPGEFKCNSAGDTRPCIPKMWRCDGESDCHDGSDENYCEATTEMPASPSHQTSSIRTTTAMPSSAATMTSKQPTTRGDRITTDFSQTATTRVPAFSTEQTTRSFYQTTDMPTSDITMTTRIPTVVDGKETTGISHTASLQTGSTQVTSTGSSIHASNGDQSTFIPTTEDTSQLGSGTDDLSTSLHQSVVTTSSNISATTKSVIVVTPSSEETTVISTTAACQKSHFKCADGHCLPKNFQCDGEPDCNDRSDEYNCDEIVCEGGQFHCKSGACIPGYWECDTVEDCIDGTDERNCDGRLGTIQPLVSITTTTTSSTMSTVTTSISTENHSEQTKQPTNSTDKSTEALSTVGDVTTSGYNQTTYIEIPSVTGPNVSPTNNLTTFEQTKTSLPSTLPVCNKAEFQCGDGQCLPVTFRCDHDNDCSDGSDEQSCDAIPCDDNGFKCRYGSCIPGHWECDTVEDCFDGSDESDCNGRLGTIQPLVSLTTRDSVIATSTTPVSELIYPTTIQKSSTATTQTTDVSSTMANDVTTPETIQSATALSTINTSSIIQCDDVDFRCNNGHCLVVTFMCDGNDDCGDNSDEHTCDSFKCKASQFQCKSGSCIPGYWECDTVEDCYDGSDESHCNGRMGTIRPLVPLTSRAPSVIKSIVPGVAIRQTAVSFDQTHKSSATWNAKRSITSNQCMDWLGEGTCEFVKNDCHDTEVARNCQMTCGACGRPEQEQSADYNFARKQNTYH